MAGQSSTGQPCSVMSGQTPVAMLWSTARTSSTSTPCFSRIRRLRFTSPSVLLGSGDRFRVQFTYSARRSSYRVSGIALLLLVKGYWSSSASARSSGGSVPAARRALHEETGTMDEGTLVSTRRALHGVAELILAGPQYRRGGGIKLR